MNTELLIPSAEELAACNASMKVSAIDANDFPDWEARLADPKNDPRPHMRAQRQERSDCQGQSLANGEEKRTWYSTGKMIQLADIFAYNGSEYISGTNNIGRDQGTSIQSGVRLLTEGIQSIGVKPGLPLESAWPYYSYERSAGNFANRAKQVEIESSMTTEHGPMPDFQGMLITVAAGGSGHIGTFWPPQWAKLEGRRMMDSAPTGGGGHATEIIWAEKIGGRWYLVVWNSHGDQFYWMSQRCYEQLQRSQFSPFGAYVLLPDRAKERYHDRVASGGGYFRPRNQGVA